jgi:hypothetical protein
VSAGNLVMSEQGLYVLPAEHADALANPATDTFAAPFFPAIKGTVR